MGRLGYLRGVGYLVEFPTSDEAAYITGGAFIIDGGACLPETNAMGQRK